MKVWQWVCIVLFALVGLALAWSGISYGPEYVSPGWMPLALIGLGVVGALLPLGVWALVVDHIHYMEAATLLVGSWFTYAIGFLIPVIIWLCMHVHVTVG